MKLIGLAGRAGAGKTTIAIHLFEKYGFEEVAFADPLKKMLIEAGLCTWEECYIQKTERSRELMQKVGTDIFRKQVDPLYWVNKCEDEICRIWREEKKPVVVHDVRFPEEAERILSLGGLLIKVVRGDYVNDSAGSTHESECLVDAIDCHHIIMANSGEVNKLLWQMDEIMEAVDVSMRGCVEAGKCKSG